MEEVHKFYKGRQKSKGREFRVALGAKRYKDIFNKRIWSERF